MKNLFAFLLLIILLASCRDKENQPTTSEDNFNRQAMLINWADNIIIPAYTSFAEKTAALKTAAGIFASNPTLLNYQDLTNKWESAYLVFQDVSMFEIGKAEALRLTNNLNIYPTDINALTDNVLNGGYNLELPSQIAMQGFPALDYLLFGLAENQTAIINFYQNDANANSYLNYLNELANRIDALSRNVLSDWNDTYRDQFIENKGNSALASVDQLTNDFIFYYERHLRAGKIGIPAGVFSGDPLPQNVEAFYRKDLSKLLFNRALDAVQNFFNGLHYEHLIEGESMKSYIEYLAVEKNGESLAKVINDQFQAARNTAEGLSNNFAEQVEMDNVRLLATYDQLQLNVVHIKVDMLQAFNVNVDYVDADGD